MSKQLAISGSLVDVRNIHSNKSVRLSIEVPAEYAGRVVAIFGWPSQAEPVAVAIARLVETPTETKTLPAAAVEEHKERRPLKSLPLPQQAALLGKDPRFRAFLHEQYGLDSETPEQAASAIRMLCNVDSRSNLNADERAAKRWKEIISKYELDRELSNVGIET